MAVLLGPDAVQEALLNRDLNAWPADGTFEVYPAIRSMIFNLTSEVPMIIFHLAKHASWQELCREDSAVLDLVRKESLRLVLPLPQLARRVVKPTTVPRTRRTGTPGCRSAAASTTTSACTSPLPS